MKRIVLIIVMVLFTMPAYSAVRISIEPTVGYSMPGDFENLIVYGGGIGFDIYRNLEIGYRFIRGEKSDARGTSTDTDDQRWKMETHSMFCFYRYPLPLGIPISVIGGGSLGYTMSNATDFYSSQSTSSDLSDKGLSFYAGGGIQFDATQKISLFAQAGYQATVYNDDFVNNDVSTNGLQILFGVKYNIWGVNKSLYEDY